MLPFMKLWIWQWYLTVPALAGSVILPDEPLAISPASKLLSSAVRVCVVVSSFLTVIVAPAGALSGSGENLKSLIVITVPDVPPDVALPAGLALFFLSLPDDVRLLLAEAEIAPGSLDLEITESALLADPLRAADVVRRLSALGVRIAIDDFGTGYSSLAYLKRLPVDELKIDRSFVRDLATDDDDLAIVRSTISLGHDLGLTIVAEGIEDAGTSDLLRRLGCDIAQGFFIGRPMSAAALVAGLGTSETALAA